MSTPFFPCRLRVENLAGVAGAGWPVTSGVPFPQGILHREGPLALSRAGEALPLQWQPLTFWPDGSVKWALLDFQTALAPDEQAAYELTIGPASPPPAQRVRAAKRDGVVTIDTGPLRLTLREQPFRLFSEVAVRDEQGRWRTVVAASPTCDGLSVADGRRVYRSCERPVRLRIERHGPLHATVVAEGEHVSRSGQRCFSFVVRLHAYAGCDFVKVEHRFLNDNPTGNFTAIRSLGLSLELAEPARQARIGGDAAPHESDGEPLALFQEDHERYQVGEAQGRRAPGWIAAESAAGCVTAAVVDFWQQWPKRLGFTDGGRMHLELLPTLRPGQYAGREPTERYYYLFDGPNYRIKTGVAKSHEVWFRFTPKPADPAAFNAVVQTPPVAVPRPEWSAASGAWGDLVVAGTPGAEEYDRLAAAAFTALREGIETEGLYGLLNWGDWFGERVYNWGNNEYDTAHALFLQLARTGDARYFHVARRFARHTADVDILHAFNDDYLNNGEIQEGYGLPVNVGAVYLHALGHVAGYFPLATAKKRWPGSYYYGDIHNLGHLWNEGMLENYYLTGDPWTREAALQVADNLAAISRVPGFTWWFGKDPHCGRVAGWPLTALCAAYNATGKREYLRAARHIVEHALADQDPNCGGWIYSLYPGHCYCRQGHVGMATFITAVLLNGMCLYHQITGDERVAQSIVRAVDYVIADSWVEKSAEFRYTSCPATEPRTDPLVLRSIAYAKRLSGSPRHAEVLQRAWERLMAVLRTEDRWGASYAVSFTWNHREMPRVLRDLLAK
ncbi:MAG: hypothetical protein GX774_17335 [Armatimonadetes bacterium]|nr:hypothetical protein [Armatimonadota bacterium]